jgi:hypothetical protein
MNPLITLMELHMTKNRTPKVLEISGDNTELFTVISFVKNRIILADIKGNGRTLPVSGNENLKINDTVWL